MKETGLSNLNTVSEYALANAGRAVTVEPMG